MNSLHMLLKRTLANEGFLTFGTGKWLHVYKIQEQIRDQSTNQESPYISKLMINNF